MNPLASSNISRNAWRIFTSGAELLPDTHPGDQDVPARLH